MKKMKRRAFNWEIIRAFNWEIIFRYLTKDFYPEHIKNPLNSTLRNKQGFSGGSVVKNLSANSGD